MSEEQPQIKVIDKRRSGSDKSSSKEEKKSEPVEQAASTEVKNEESVGHSEQAHEIDFTSFIMSLSTQAIIMLGEVANPETGIVSVNLEGAKQTIDILVMLLDKTKGNLSEEEDRLMSELVSSLQMAYVNKMKG